MVLGIYCSGGFGGVVLALAEQINQWESICFIDDGKPEAKFEYPLYHFDDFVRMYPPDSTEILIASGEPTVRKKLFDKVHNYGYHLPNLCSPKASCVAFKSIGEGNVILDFAYLSGSSLVVGNNNIFMPFALVSHSCIIHDHIIVSSSANINGGVTVEDCVYIGSGAIIREWAKVGTESVIGMGAVVTKNVENNCVMVGNPARVQRINQNKGVFKAHESE